MSHILLCDIDLVLNYVIELSFYFVDRSRGAMSSSRKEVSNVCQRPNYLICASYSRGLTGIFMMILKGAL